MKVDFDKYIRNIEERIAELDDTIEDIGRLADMDISIPGPSDEDLTTLKDLVQVKSGGLLGKCSASLITTRETLSSFKWTIERVKSMVEQKVSEGKEA